MATAGTYETPTTNLRTPGGLAVETVTTHLFAIANYAYTSTLQQRPTHTSLHAMRVLLFAFVPTLIIVECTNSVIRALIQFVRTQIDEEEKNVWFHLSAAVGMHASMPITNHATKKDEIHKVPLLKLDPTTTERERIGWSWAWAGKLLITIFALTQATGSIVLYVRRVHHDTLNFDHRNGAMAIASTICSVFSIFALLLRFDWSVGRALQSAATEKLHAQISTLILHTFLAMGLHHLVALSVNHYENEWLYTSTGVVFLLSGFFGPRYGRRPLPFAGWQNILLAILVFVFRKDIASKVGVDSGRYQTWIRHRSWLRIKALLTVGLVMWFLTDIGKLFVKDVINVVRKRGDEDYWWQDPIGDKIFVI
ncbi:hypothetical protein H2200_008888 [Cladophialophora chaetospira]|uniref:Uncharacterized protein n=1 Tax=Cladophialophora chaetospira TaxID=386627 RepID=A0AA39CFQ0_9EURO|nr:hypothetical protein H2200_008888 [Cladophialophora chaetospira]